MKKVLYILIVLMVFSLVSCNDEKHDFSGQYKVTYYLEGGSYQNCSLPVELYYNFNESSKKIIKPLEDFSEKEITKSEYVLEGWYLTKNVDGDTITYSNKYDFTKEATGDFLVLYANWIKETKFSYTVCYYDTDESIKTLGVYYVNAGDKFVDTKQVYSRAGYTKISYLDSTGNVWDDNYTHPGDENSPNVNVFVKYIEGSYSLVSSYKELVNAKTKNIYLTADIDCEGNEINFGDYHKTFAGNNHTISNFTIKYSALKNDLVEDLEDPARSSLMISIFGNMYDASISDVNFTDVKVNVKTKLSSTYRIYVCAIATSITNSNVSNVNFSGTYKIEELPTDYDTENLIVVTDKLYYQKDAASSVANTNITFIEEVE